jgi:hypothetical protein
MAVLLVQLGRDRLLVVHEDTHCCAVGVCRFMAPKDEYETDVGAFLLRLF